MQFKPELVEKILIGEKVQTRRPVKDGDQHLPRNKDPHGPIGIYRNKRLMWEVGRTYAVQPGRGKKSVGRIELLKIQREDVRTINHQDAIAEGFGDNPIPRLGFLDVWREFYDASFKYPIALGFGAAIAGRPADKYQGWVLEFKLVEIYVDEAAVWFPDLDVEKLASGLEVTHGWRG